MSVDQRLSSTPDSKGTMKNADGYRLSDTTLETEIEGTGDSVHKSASYLATEGGENAQRPSEVDTGDHWPPAEIPAQEREEIDWGHATGEARRETRKTRQMSKSQDTSDYENQHQDIENNIELREQVGVLAPEEIMHKGEKNHHETEDHLTVHTENELSPCVQCQELQRKFMENVEARKEAESQELSNIRPKIKINIHDPRAREVADLVKKQVKSDEIGPTFEQTVHGRKNIHDHTDPEPGSNVKHGKSIKYQDIVDLGLSEEILKGIDISQLLQQEKAESEEWKRFSGHDEDDKLSAHIKHLDLPDLDTAEWDDSYGDVNTEGRELPHPGESRLEHEMEMWGSTAANSQRGDLRLSGSPSGHGAGGVDRSRERRIPTDLRANSLATVPPTPPASGRYLRN
ncbi:hypothetical protein PoB_000515200 [Plakobranchus ocellatus]|uniref:Uncharacterized protein n=1 Tax=Plakobranchus ocellatus TaxID=259542 RepID=A0AAV3Y779_9GAST|nr:hypothetical protein PoB_000515200 [Plakobranchus ocellatus]